MNRLREARLVIAVITMVAGALAGASLADDPKTKPETKPHTEAAAPEQVWEGKLSVGAGLSLRIVVHVGKTADGKLTAKMDSPDQGARGLKVDYDHPRQDKPVIRDEGDPGEVRGQAERRRDRSGRNLVAGRQQPSTDLEEDRQGHRAASAADAQGSFSLQGRRGQLSRTRPGE